MLDKFKQLIKNEQYFIIAVYGAWTVEEQVTQVVPTGNVIVYAYSLTSHVQTLKRQEVRKLIVLGGRTIRPFV